jgi:hypothetical protein
MSRTAHDERATPTPPTPARPRRQPAPFSPRKKIDFNGAHVAEVEVSEGTHTAEEEDEDDEEEEEGEGDDDEGEAHTTKTPKEKRAESRQKEVAEIVNGIKHHNNNHHHLLQSLNNNSNRHLQLQQQQNAAKSSEALPKINSNSKLLAVVVVIQTIDRKISTVGYDGTAELLGEVIAVERVQTAIITAITNGACDAEIWSQLASYIVTELCSNKAGDTVERMCKEALLPKNFKATIATAPEGHLNTLARAFFLVRWFCALVKCKDLTADETASLFDKHVDEFPYEVFTALQQDILGTTDFDELLVAYKSLPVSTRLTCITAWMYKFGERATPMASLLMEGGQGRGQPPDSSQRQSKDPAKRPKENNDRGRDRDRDRGKEHRDRSRSPGRPKDYRPRQGNKYGDKSRDIGKPRKPCYSKACQRVIHERYEDYPMFDTCYNCGPPPANQAGNGMHLNR